ncbi:MAG TPA: adenylate/guanylate cyclase domain-containing protein [Nitrosopumilus sp.]|jgi:class 3 adenylate cyclase|nr:adenylate/guanylate cyclase domain-containing protein [Nitrosopumilus sp.]HJM79839.1 adenylate/guanylate cyclase domain-containing protein [Nitrosopumilus sp.]
MSSFTFFSLQKKLLVLVLSSTLISISITTVIFLNFDNISIFQLQENIIIIGVSLMIGLSVLTYFLSKRLSEPITKLSEATYQISRGDFNVRTNIKSRDEIGNLSESFDHMAKKLQEAEITIKQKEEVIKQQEDILLKFSQHTQNDCVCVIDMKDSTKISAKLADHEVTKLYEIFLNFMAKIVQNYNGQVVKNIGDALMFRFPNVDLYDSKVLKNIVECCLNMIESHDDLTNELKKEKMPELNYKISISYGSVKVAQSTTSTISDIFGPTVNRCFKINSLCPENGLIIDNNLFHAFKNFSEYDISQLSETEINKKYGYKIFQIKRK